MVGANRSEAVATLSIEHAMSSLPPPPMGPGGHPRYSQHPERDRPGGPAMGYGSGAFLSGPPPPSHGNSYSSYPPQPYGSAMHGNYGAGPIQGQPPPGYPRGGYSVPPHSSSYGSGYGPVGNAGAYPQSIHQPPYYAAGYDSHYGGQPPPPGHPGGPQSSYRGPSPIPPPSSGGPGNSVLRGAPNSGMPTAPPSSDQHSLVSAGSTLLSKKARSPPKAANEISAKSSSAEQSSEITQQHSLPDHGEVERLRAAAARELTTEEVKPIQTDFHFFVKENVDKYRKLAEEEVRNSLKDNDDAAKSGKLDPLLVNSNLNNRLMKAWEKFNKADRDSYMIQEEADRRRFMEDDEIASRHCATLTARGKSPRVVGGDKEKIKKEPQEPKEALKKKDSDGEEKKTDVPIKEEPKRPVGETGENLESPSKKSKAVQ